MSVLLTSMQPLYTSGDIVIASKQDLSEEYTSELNPIKPSEASDDYVIKFEDVELKKVLLNMMRKGENDVITVKDAKSFSQRLTYSTKSEKSLEGLQYFNSLKYLVLKDGEEIIQKSLEPIKNLNLESFGFYNYNLKEIPKMELLKKAKFIRLENNKISNLNGIEYYNGVSGFYLSNNLINDISGIENIGGNLTFVDLSNNKLESINPLTGNADKFPVIRTLKLNSNRINDFSPLDGFRFTGSHQGVQDILRITDDGTFELPLVEFYNDRVEGSTTDRIYGVRSLALSTGEKDEIEKVDKDNYRVKNINQDYLSYGYYSKVGYENKRTVMLNCKATIINFKPVNDAIIKLENENTPENREKLNDMVKDLKNIQSVWSDNSELNERIASVERKLIVLENGIDEYTSIYNPKKPSEIKDDEIVNIPDPGFKAMLHHFLNKSENDEITAGEMRKLTYLSNIKESPGSSTAISINSLEGIQYAENLVQFRTSFIYTPKVQEYKNQNKNIFWKLTDSELEELTKEPTGRIDPLRGLIKLEDLSLSLSCINSLDLQNLEKLSKLKILSLRTNPITDIQSISKLKNLEILEIGSAAIEDASPISLLENLKWLDLYNNKLWKNNLDFLKKSKSVDKLEDIALGANEINDISDLPYFKNLKALSLVGNNISDISNLEQYENIEYLNLNDNLITDISPLKSFDFTDIYGRHIAGQYTEVLVDEDGKFEFFAKDKNGAEVEIESSTDIIKIGKFKYELANKLELSLEKEYSTGRGNHAIKGPLFGKVRIINRPRILKLVEDAEKNPTQTNINRALDAVEHLRNTKISKELFEESQELKAKLEALKPDVSAKSVSLNKDKLLLTAGEKEKLTATVKPDNATNKEVTWSSSDDSIAKVDSRGNVEAVAEGKATITATVKGTDIKATAEVTVEPVEEEVKAESIELDAVKIDMYKGQKDKIEATVKPAKAVNKEVEWSSSDDSIVKVDADGNIEAVGVGTATITAKVKGTDIKASVEVVSSEVTAPIVSKFTDIDGHWAKSYIEHSAERGLFKGTTESSFSPELNMTRGMFVTVLGRLAEETADPNDKFADVNREAYYAEYIAWAEENGIVEGYGNGNFGPDNNVTREEMAAIIERYMKYKGIELEDNGAATFAEADSISDWAKESVTKIQKAGIIEGKGNGVFDPQANSTRAEVATLLIRMIEKYIK